MTLTAQGKVSLRTKTYPFDSALDALDDLDAGRLPGTRAILVSLDLQSPAPYSRQLAQC